MNTVSPIYHHDRAVRYCGRWIRTSHVALQSFVAHSCSGLSTFTGRASASAGSSRAPTRSRVD
jgi:hypothetical protein